MFDIKVKNSFPLFSDYSERNNDYSDTLDFRTGGGVTFFVSEVTDYKSAMLDRKLRKTRLSEGITVLRGGRCTETKINVTCFVGTEILNIFYLTIFSKKTIFSKITAKIIFGGHAHF